MTQDVLGASAYDYTGYESAFVPTPALSPVNSADLPPLTESAKRMMAVTGGVKPGAEPPKPPVPAKVETQPMQSTASQPQDSKDMRVRIRVPTDYITKLTQGSGWEEFSPSNFGGIIFPYTPQITLEHKAEYTQQQPLHTNYAINFYKNSQISDITVSGKWTVQNDRDAMTYLSAVRLLAALTKMRFGGKGGDPDSGAPPPVCRLDAYGEFMLKDIPVAITSFKHDLPDDVDFYSLKTRTNFGSAMVPTRSTISVTCRPMYSRSEMQKISVTGYLAGQRGGYL